MPDTVAFQKRITQVGVFGAAEYRVETYIDDRGDLPDSGAFLLEIVAGDDPSLDALARVSTVADLMTYRTDRVLAVRYGERFYRAAAVTVAYTDLNVAKTAAAVLEDFVNRLVVAIVSFNTEFSTLGIVGPPEDYEELTFPLVTMAIEERLTGDYRTKKQLVADGQAAAVAKEVSCEALVVVLNAATTQLTELKLLQTTLGDLDAQLSASVVAFGAVFTNGEAFSADVDAGIDAYELDVAALPITDSADSWDYFRDPDRTQSGEVDEGSVPKLLDPFNVSLRAGRAALATLNQRIVSLATARATVTSQVALKEVDVATLEADGAACASEKRVLDTDLAAAQVELQQSEDAILAVCPDFDRDAIETT